MREITMKVPAKHMACLLRGVLILETLHRYLDEASLLKFR